MWNFLNTTWLTHSSRYLVQVKDVLLEGDGDESFEESKDVTSFVLENFVFSL